MSLACPICPVFSACPVFSVCPACPVRPACPLCPLERNNWAGKRLRYRKMSLAYVLSTADRKGMILMQDLILILMILGICSYSKCFKSIYTEMGLRQFQKKKPVLQITILLSTVVPVSVTPYLFRNRSSSSHERRIHCFHLQQAIFHYVHSENHQKNYHCTWKTVLYHIENIWILWQNKAFILIKW